MDDTVLALALTALTIAPFFAFRALRAFVASVNCAVSRPGGAEYWQYADAQGGH